MSTEIQIFPPDAAIALQDFQWWYLQVYLQLKKDFHPHAQLAESPDNLDSKWIYDEVKNILSHIIENKNQSLHGIINRVDISEKQLKKWMATNTTSEKLDALTEMIIKREALKVWIRNTLR